MNEIRYNAADTKKALEILGFNVRNPSSGNTFFCIHKLTGDEVWIPKIDDGVLEDVLKCLFEPIKLPIIFFRSVYMSLHDTNKFPADQH